MKQESLLGNDFESHTSGPVECLGMTFENDEARRAHFTELLREKLKDPEFRAIEGFPIGSDEAILELSDPPYYTACPNPWLGDLVKAHVTDITLKKEVEPLAYDVSEGKRDPLYEHYSYHTKVPHKAVARYIEHYTNPGDVVLDAFCGSGMTGLAAKWLAEQPLESGGGERQVILNDLSTYAAFIAKNYSRRTELSDISSIVDKVSESLSWMYKTYDDTGVLRDINYTVWSDVFSCPECGEEIVFFDEFVDPETGKVTDSGICPSCSKVSNKSELDNVFVTEWDDTLNKNVKVRKQIPVLIRYFIGKKQLEKKPDDYDFSLLRKINEYSFDNSLPSIELRDGDNTSQPIKSHGITHSHQFFTKRNLIAIGELYKLIFKLDNNRWLFELLGCFRVWTKRSIFLTTAWKQGGTGAFKPSSSGILYVPSISGERNVIKSFQDRVNKALKFNSSQPNSKHPAFVSNGSTSDLRFIESNTIDYIFIDPPFGGNIMYSELNLVFEPWLGLVTNEKKEAICNKTQSKDLDYYNNAMFKCFSELYRVLKPKKWMSVEFHNSKNSIWNSIQDSLSRAGFVVADVRVLDKKQGTFKQYTSTGAVKQDLVITAYKPSDEFTADFKLKSGSIEGVWSFVENHLSSLPITSKKGNSLEAIAERQKYLLFDRMVSFHIRNGISVPMSAPEFYSALRDKFIEIDAQYFLAEQASVYNKERAIAGNVTQLSIFVNDEATAIRWCRELLEKSPKQIKDIQPEFLKSMSWLKSEKDVELLDILNENFIRYDGVDEVPSQIHTYLSTNFKDMRGLEKNDPKLKAKAKDRWYVPDPNKAADLEKVRLRALLKEFESYKAEKKKIKQPRAEALRAGFNAAWEAQDFQTILDVSAKIPTDVLQEDEKLLMFYDNALTLTTSEDDEW
ncbi:DNA methyltransferase [Vibrio cholerae]|uniref:DNA methyltransferase n=1 Tax=Vibrio cholerae TaxID=666 RepID=UPI001E4E7E9B|nr:DNA methyltransferase [Vibrio cholerae]MCD1237642.1 hypothetical protein [Vibrio cholerae]